MDDHLLIVSHRRSGTHLTIDAIRNNFPCFKNRPLLTLETLQLAHPEHLSVPEFNAELTKTSRIVKTHYFPVFQDLLPDPGSLELVKQTYQDSKIIYVVRNGLDVLASLYEFRKSHCEATRQLSFSEFIRLPTFDPEHKDLNKIQYWRKHVKDWLESEFCNELMVVQFEDWITNYKHTLKKVGSFLGKRSNWRTKDVRFGKQKDSGIEHTTVVGRKGEIGDFSTAFSRQDLDLFFDHAGDLMKTLGYANLAKVPARC